MMKNFEPNVSVIYIFGHFLYKSEGIVDIWKPYVIT